MRCAIHNHTVMDNPPLAIKNKHRLRSLNVRSRGYICFQYKSNISDRCVNTLNVFIWKDGVCWRWSDLTEEDTSRWHLKSTFKWQIVFLSCEVWYPQRREQINSHDCYWPDASSQDKWKLTQGKQWSVVQGIKEQITLTSLICLWPH